MLRINVVPTMLPQHIVRGLERRIGHPAVRRILRQLKLGVRVPIRLGRAVRFAIGGVI